MKGTTDMPESVELQRRPQNLFLLALKSRPFITLWGGQTFSQLGDSILWIALPLAVYTIGKSTLQMGIVMALLTIPQVLLLPFTGVLVDRVSRSLLMMLTDVFRFLFVLVLFILSANHHLGILLLDAFVVLYGSAGALFLPAYAAARAQVFTSEIRNSANGLTQISQQGARLIGPAIGGIVIGIFGIGAGFAIDACALLISVTSLAFLRLHRVKRTSETRRFSVRQFFGEIAGGYFALRRHDWLWITIVVFALINISSGGIGAILVPWLIIVHLGLSPLAYGLYSSALGFGAILYAVIYGRRQKWHRRGLIAYGGVALSALAGFALVFAHQVLLLMLFAAFSGAGIMAFGLTWEVSLQELILPEEYGRVASLDFFGSYALLPVGNIVTGWVSTLIGGIRTIEVEALFTLLVVIVVLFIPAIRQFD